MNDPTCFNILLLSLGLPTWRGKLFEAEKIADKKMDEENQASSDYRKY